MLQSAHCSVAVGAGLLRGKSYAVHVLWDGSVMPTTKPGQVDPVFAREVLFAFCVREGGWGSKERVRWKRVNCSLCKCGVYMGAVGGVIRNGWEGIKEGLVELGRGGVRRAGTRATGRGATKVVEGVCWVSGGGVNVCTCHTHVLFEWEY